MTNASVPAGRPRVKVGIDVGGTFTHAVAVEAQTLSLLGKIRVPTTHGATQGVAQGVVEALGQLLHRLALNPADVVLIAHSTTQATNALLEGDVAKVGILGLGSGATALAARWQTQITDMELAPGQRLPTAHRFLDTGRDLTTEQVKQAVAELHAEGASAFTVSAAFAVDDPQAEQQVVTWLRNWGHLATAGHEVSQLYGLQLRTRTAVINASILPKMLETANHTEAAVRALGIDAPLMIMRSDGGIMDIQEMRRRPILTILSGPAAGVAAALMYARVSDGVFLDVGGTSTDISVIKNGRPTVRTAEVAGRKLYLKALDVRTLGVAGGSMVRFQGHHPIAVGPRSAHIAGLRYLSFAPAAESGELTVHRVQPKPQDPKDYLGLGRPADGQPTWTFTPTEAANLLGLIQGEARSESPGLHQGAAVLAQAWQTTVPALATRVLDLAVARLKPTLTQLIQEYDLDPRTLTLVGGGGGAEALVPYLAQSLGWKHWIAPDAEVIAAIGVALGLVRDRIERSVVNPSPADILRIRQEVIEAVVRLGARPEAVDVQVEVDSRQQRLIATASGALDMDTGQVPSAPPSPEDCLARAAASLNRPAAAVRCVAETPFFRVYQAEIPQRAWWSWGAAGRPGVRVVDRQGIIRLQLNRGTIWAAPLGDLLASLETHLESHKTYGDGGELYPDTFILAAGRLLDLTGLTTQAQILALARAELETLARETSTVLVLRSR
ncbi:MAG: hydantoinase/oxoprolinase family protein [Gloeomargaritaceae cyanobacterium C42_A2020_066]|nr:hydantoinase/oxoprolinase family protein [Gloeomargaritaceae cyanobacterium C42_A2020_066]